MNKKLTISELANMISEDDPRDPGAELAGRLQDRGDGAQPLEGVVVSHFPRGAQPTGTYVLQIEYGGYSWNVNVPTDEFDDAQNEINRDKKLL